MSRSDEELTGQLEAYQRALKDVLSVYESGDEQAGNLRFDIWKRDFKRFLEGNDLGDEAKTGNLYTTDYQSAKNSVDRVNRIIADVKNRK